MEAASFKKPPEAAKEVYACLVYILTGKKENWEFISKFLKKNSQCFKALEEFDPVSKAKNLSKKDIKFFKRYRGFNYTEDYINRISANCVLVIRMIKAFFDIVDSCYPNSLLDSAPVEIQENAQENQ